MFSVTDEDHNGGEEEEEVSDGRPSVDPKEVTTLLLESGFLKCNVKLRPQNAMTIGLSDTPL